jgi:hypothetical protein
MTGGHRASLDRYLEHVRGAFGDDTDDFLATGVAGEEGEAQEQRRGDTATPRQGELSARANPEHAF